MTVSAVSLEEKEQTKWFMILLSLKEKTHKITQEYFKLIAVYWQQLAKQPFAHQHSDN